MVILTAVLHLQVAATLLWLRRVVVILTAVLLLLLGRSYTTLVAQVVAIKVMLCMVSVVWTSPFDLRGGNVFRVQSYGNVSSHPMTFLSSTDRTHSPVIVYISSIPQILRSRVLRSSDPEIQGTQILRPSDPSDP